MKPGPLLLLAGSVALWMGLPAAPPQRTPGQAPLSSSCAPGEAPQDKVSQEQDARLPEEPQVSQKSSLPQGEESGGNGQMGAEEVQPGKEGGLPPEAAAPAPPGKLLCKENPHPKRLPVNNLEVESSGGLRPTESLHGASEKDPPLGTQAQLGGDPAVSREKRLPGGKEKPSPLGRPRLAFKSAWPNLETWNPVWDPSDMATSGGKPNTSKKPTSSTPGDKPTPGKPTPTEKPVPGSGHPIQDEPKPASAAGHHVGPTSGEKPAPNSGPEAHGSPVTGGKPTSGEKPSSQEGHEKCPSADRPTSSEKPEHGEEPQAEKESSPEKEAEEGKKTEEEEKEEEGLFDEDDGEEEEEEKDKENEGGTPGGNQDGSDAFDKELDYGLKTPPFDASSYHDAWSDDGAEEADLGSVGEMAALPQSGEASNDGKPTFDAWGDLVGGSRP